MVDNGGRIAFCDNHTDYSNHSLSGVVDKAVKE